MEFPNLIFVERITKFFLSLNSFLMQDFVHKIGMISIILNKIGKYLLIYVSYYYRQPTYVRLDDLKYCVLLHQFMKFYEIWKIHFYY